jgi:hypothetical protein
MRFAGVHVGRCIEIRIDISVHRTLTPDAFARDEATGNEFDALVPN